MLDYTYLEAANERHERLIRDAETIRRALRARKAQPSSILKSLIIFLIAVA